MTNLGIINGKTLKKQLILFEGMRLKPYLCTSQKTTIGVGRNLDDVGITEAEAQMLLEHDILRCCEDLDRAMPWWRDLSEARQRVCVDIVFNLGLGRWLGFKKCISALQEEDWDEAAAQLLDSRYARQVGQRAERLAQALIDDELEID